MRKDAPVLEEKRLEGISSIEDYPSFHERHRAFPVVFEDRDHHKILDIAAGVGAAARRIGQLYPADLLCNDISETALAVLRKQGLKVTSFDIDDDQCPFPFPDRTFDAVVSLATIEHVIHLDHHVREIQRILQDGGYLYISSPNYASFVHFPAYLFQGRTFHNPLVENQRYEFYAHVRYFTYRSLLEFVQSFGFQPVAVYLPIPAGSSFYRRLYSRSKSQAMAFRFGMQMIYRFLSPRWAPEPILCFRKPNGESAPRFRKVLIK